MSEAVDLLYDIKAFIVTASRSNITEAERNSLRFNSGAEIVEAIDQLGSQESIFDPYTDPDTVAMLERSGIATYKFRQ